MNCVVKWNQYHKGEDHERKKEIYVVSACLLGENCKYNGGNNLTSEVVEFLKDKTYITICPETYGGLPAPRDPSEIVITDGITKVLAKNGTDVTAEFVKGAQISAKKAKENGCTHAILKARSPSCGVGKIYDGTFSGTITDKNGIAAKMLREMGIICITEEDL